MNAAKLIPLSVAFGLWAVSIKAAPLSPEEAAAYIGETATVCSVVVSIKFVTTSLSHPTYRLSVTLTRLRASSNA
jgi:hypothetical protein